MLELMKFVAPILSVVSFILLICVDSIKKLSEVKVLRFTLSGVMIATVVAYAFQMVFKISSFAPFGMIVWFAIALSNFDQATQLTTK
ncbi:MAG TPA: hypothetical protein ENL05_00850 [Candidatus Moranbacteria bacterium]|nr:hypothetical protein [Candidatus Moranbacteria bacterium]